MTVTTGGRGASSVSPCSAASSRYASGSESLAAAALCPISSTTIIPVSWSSTWLIVTIWPSFISTLMTSAAFTDILWARSATVIVSGTWISRTTGSTGPAAGRAVSSACLWRPPFGVCQPVPPVASPRVLIARFFALSSRQTVTCFAGFFAFFSAASAVFGLCSVVSAAAGCVGAAAACAAARAASSAARCSASRFSASRRSRSAFSASSAAWRAASSASRRLSCSRSSTSRPSTWWRGAGGASTAVAGWPSPASRFTNTRFLRTSTWIVRALPDESAFLISLVCLRVSVILFFPSAGAVRLAEVIEELRLVLLGERVVGEHLVDARRPQLLEQHLRRHLQLAGKLRNAHVCHVAVLTPRRRTSVRAPS